MGKTKDSRIEDMLYKTAAGYTQRVKKVYKLKEAYYDERGKKVENEHLEEREEEQYFPPNLSAITFWLKSRKPEKWSEKKAEQTDEAGQLGIVILPGVIEGKEESENGE